MREYDANILESGAFNDELGVLIFTDCLKELDLSVVNEEAYMAFNIVKEKILQGQVPCNSDYSFAHRLCGMYADFVQEHGSSNIVEFWEMRELLEVAYMEEDQEMVNHLTDILDRGI